ncbi:MAG: putative Ig domain-containing protein, partial [Acidobacteria bacterium]|nr:putative Ig domain-containing protein [Acidobacteriota bacterium]
MTKRLAVGYLIALTMMAVFVFGQAAGPMYLNTLSPTSVVEGSGPFTLQITGIFTGCSPVINFNGTPLVTTPVNSFTLNGAVPGSLVATYGTYPVLLTSGTCLSSAPLYFTVDVRPLVFATSTPLPRAIATLPYSTSISASGGLPPYSWQYSSAGFPPGLTFTGGVTPSATIAGTPITPGTYTFTIYLNDLGDHAPIQKDYTLTVVPPLQITTTSVANGTVGKAYTQAISTIDGVAPYSWSVISGSLPPGLAMDPSTGTITGTPTTAGAFPFTLRAQEGTAKTAQHSYSITIITPPLEIPASSLPAGRVGIPFSSQIGTTGGTAPVRFRIDSGLPPGLVLDPATGIVSG